MDKVSIEIESDCMAAEIIVKAGVGYAYVHLKGTSFEAALWPEIKGEVDRLLALAVNAVSSEHQPKDNPND